MQRRKARDDPMDRLELGHQANFTTSIPMKKITKMKFVKYLILILVAVVIHTTYRLLWKTGNDSETLSRTNDERAQVEFEINSFKQKSNDIDPLKRRPVDVDSTNDRGKFDDPRDFVDKLYNHEETDKETGKNKIIDTNVDEDSKRMSLLKNKRERFENLKKSIEKAKKELEAKDDGIKLSNQVNDDGPVKESSDIKEDQPKAIETLELEKEHIIESKIAEVLNEVKVSDEVTQETDKAKERVEIEKEELRLKNPNAFEKKPATIPSPDGEFIKKANKVVEKIQSDNNAPTLITDHKHGEPVLVTAATSKTFDQIKQLVFSLQKFNPKDKIYIFDLDLTDRQRMHLMAACNVRVREFWSNLFPSFISNWEHFHWKPLVIQTALAEFGHIIWINPGNVVIASTLPEIAKESKDLKMKIIGQNQQFTTYAVTHRQMYKYLPTDKKKLFNSPHIEIHALLLHSTEEIMENLMKLIVACAMEPKCMAPASTKWQCDFDFSGKEYANCHRYDESAINIAIKNWYNFDTSSVLKTSNIFRSYDPDEKLPLKMCRDEKDMKRR